MFNLSSAALGLGLLVSSVAAQNGTLTVIHGVPGLPAPVEVFANGNSLFTFDFTDQEGPLSLAPGAYALDVRLNGQSILSTTANVTAGLNATVLAHLDSAGSPTLSLFANDTSALALPQSRVVVRHTAAAPAVDILLEQNGSVVGTLGGLVNGQAQQADVPPGIYDVRINAAGTATTAFGPVALNLEDGYAYAVHAIGDLGAGSFTLALQRIDLASRVSVVHGIPGLPAPVDVLANGSALFSFDFDSVAGPLVLAPATYNLGVSLNGQVVLQTNATVAAGDDATVVAHLDAAGANTLTLFGNDQSALSGNDNVRVTVRHVAAAPAVDIAVDNLGTRVATIPSLTNGTDATADLPAGLYQVSILAAGTNTVVAGPLNWKAGVGTHYFFHAIGDLVGGSFAVNLSSRDLTPAVPGALTTRTGGVGCEGSIGASPAAFAFGETFVVTLSGGPAGAIGVLNLGDSLAQAGGLALPFDFSRLGAPGCFLNANILADHPVVLDAQGAVRVELAVPSQIFAGFRPAYFQFVTRSAANSLGVTSSDYLAVELR